MNSETHTTDRENANSGLAPVAPPEDYSLALRIACWGGALDAAIGYAVLIPMKVQALLPPEMTWIRLIIGPALIVSMLPTSIVTVIWFPKREVLALSILSVVYVMVVLGIIILDSSIAF